MYTVWVSEIIPQVGATLITEALEYALHLRVQRAAQEREIMTPTDGDGSARSRRSGGGTAITVRDDAVAP